MDSRGPNPWPWIALSVGVVAAAVVAVVLILDDGSDAERGTAHGGADIARLVEPVASANDALSAELEALQVGDETEAAAAAAAAASRSTRTAGRTLPALDLTDDDQRIADAANRALLSEEAYLRTLRRALRTQDDARATSAGRAAGRARRAWEIVAREIPGAGGQITGLHSLSEWAATPVLPDGDAGPGPSAEPATPVLPDGDAGPGPIVEPESQESADGLVTTCEGFENVFEVVVEGVSCGAAIQIAQGALTSKSAAGAQGYVCTTVPQESDVGTLRYECDGPDGGHVGFTTAH
jgi:hypothetical protein